MIGMGRRVFGIMSHFLHWCQPDAADAGRKQGWNRLDTLRRSPHELSAALITDAQR